MSKYSDLTPEQIHGAKKALRKIVEEALKRNIIAGPDEPAAPIQPPTDVQIVSYTKNYEDDTIDGLFSAYAEFKAKKNNEPATERICKVLETDKKLITLLADGQNEAAIKYLAEKKGFHDLGQELVSMRSDTEEGTPIKVTFLDFYEILLASIYEQNPDETAINMLRRLIDLFTEFLNNIEELKNDPLHDSFLETLQAMSQYLQADVSGEVIEEFLKQQREFLAIPRPRSIEDLLSISSIGNGSTEISVAEFDNMKVTYSGRLGIDEQKINEMLRLAFAAKNPYKAKKNLNTLIELPLSEVMQTLGRTINPNNRKMFTRQLRREMLPNIAHEHIDIKAQDGSFIHMEIGGGYWAVNTKKDKIYFKLSDPYALYLNSGALSQYSNKILRLGSQKNPTPFYMAIKLSDHYFHDGNRKRKTNNILSVKAILKFCSDTIPSYEYVQENDPGHWLRQIRDPFEKALNEIQEIKYFKWEYCKAGLEEATPQEIRTNDYRKWSQLYITFTLIPDEPDQTQRLEHKQKRIEDAQAKKDLKDAETIIKADKIQRRKQRKKKKDAAAGL